MEITLENGTELEGYVAGHEHIEPTDVSKGSSRLTLEGDWFDQVKKLGSETVVLHLHQSFSRRSGDLETAVLTGRAWPDGGDFDDGQEVELGDVIALEKQEEANAE